MCIAGKPWVRERLAYASDAEWKSAGEDNGLILLCTGRDTN